MTTMNPLGLSCPRGGDWYICQGTKVEFVGCCTSDPCADGSGFCEQKRLRPASFSSNKYSKIPALECDDNNPRPDSVQPLWYTCSQVNPPFMGCCYNNACTAGFCADANLTAAKLVDEPVIRADFLREAGVATSEKKGLSGGAIAGIVVGVVAVLALAVGGWWYMRRKKQKQAAEKVASSTSDGLHLSPNPNGSHFTHSPHPSAVSPHSGYNYPNTPPQGYGFENGSYYSAPTELGSPSHYVAELSGNHAGEVAMLDSKPVEHHSAHSPTIPLEEIKKPNDWPQDVKDVKK